MELFCVPQAGWTMKSGTVSAWLKKEGETVRQGEPLLELETDKAVVEVEATASGVVVRILVQAGESAEVGDPLAIIAAHDEAKDTAAIDTFLKQEVAKAAAKTIANAAKEVGRAISTASNSTVNAGKQVKATPRVRKLAQELGVALEAVAATGSGGTITEEDVRRQASFAEGRRDGGPKVRERLVLSGVRKAMASRVAASWQTIPHFFQMIEINADQLLLANKEQKLSLTPFLVKAAGVALSHHSWVNATTDGEELISYADVNIAVAVGTGKGLVTPVVRNADCKLVKEIATELERLTERAHAGRLSLAELEGATFTISNLGMYGIETGTPIINKPQVALMFAGAIQKVPSWRDGKLVLASRMKLTFAYDHRVIDGIAGARFSNEVRSLLEQPESLV
jgi:pyruvate dehydrogenase E2 component (dihydrolipoamide acetyltransferase)